MRAFDLEPAGPAGFVDTEGSTHEANIDALAAAGITAGCKTDPLQFCTSDPVKRSQMATFLARALGLLETPSTMVVVEEPAPTTTVPEEATGPAPEGGHPPAPTIGMIPREHPYWDYPTCEPGQRTTSQCYPPSEWETPQDLSGCSIPDLEGGVCPTDRPDIMPRVTRDVADFVTVCESVSWNISCEWIYYWMKMPLDYLGAHPWCVIQQYYNKLAEYGSLTAAPGWEIYNNNGWHRCATIIDPPWPQDPSMLLSQTGMSLADRCRVVLPADVELEARPTSLTNLFAEPQRFGNDCDAWAEHIENRPSFQTWSDCARSAHLAEEWMEHHHNQPELYYPVKC